MAGKPALVGRFAGAGEKVGRLNVRRTIRSGVRWVFARPGYVLMTASDERLAAEPAERFRYAWLEVMVWSLVWGLALANMWGGTWRIFHDYEPMIMPALFTGMLFCLWPYRNATAALAEGIAGKSSGQRAIVSAVIVAALLLSLARLLGETERWELDWIRSLWLLVPDRKMFRVLLLMPLWGGWAMLIATRFCKCRQCAEPQVAAFAAGCGPLPAAMCMAPPLVVSMVYFHHLGVGSQVAIPVVTVVGAIAAGMLFCRAAGGLCRAALLATNAATQILFLWAYLAGRPAKWLPG